MTFQVYNPLEVDAWDDSLLEGGDPGVFFCTSTWARILLGAYHYEPVYFARTNGNRFEALLPVMQIDSFLTGKRGVSLPFTDSCTPIAQSDKQLRKLVYAAIDHASTSAWRSLEFRSGAPLPFDTAPTKRFRRHILPLDRTLGDLKKAVRASTLRNVKRAEAESILVRTACILPAMRDFYTLICMTRKRHGLPPQPWYFFETLFKEALLKGHGDLFLGYHAGKPVAGAIFLHFGKHVIYKFGASDKRFHHLRANNLIMWKAIQHYVEAGCRSLDLGRTEIGHNGLLQYKRGWGATETTLYYYRYDTRRRKFLSEKKAVPPGHALLRKLPIPVLRAIGNWLYPHIG